MAKIDFKEKSKREERKQAVSYRALKNTGLFVWDLGPQ